MVFVCGGVCAWKCLYVEVFVPGCVCPWRSLCHLKILNFRTADRPALSLWQFLSTLTVMKADHTCLHASFL